VRAWLGAVMVAAAAGTPGVPTPDHTPSSQAPSPRTDASSAYDAANGTIVLFGGADRSGVLGDTWTWDGAGWALHHPATHPPAREFAYMGFDPATSQVVLFGGTTCAPPGPSDVTGCEYQHVQTNLADTWTWDGSNWTGLETAHAPAIQAFRGDFGGIADDESHHDLILVTWPTASERSNVETWTLQDADWHQLHPTHPPAPYEFSGPAYDGVSGHLILQQQGERLSATYWWDGTDWRFFDLSVQTPHSYGELVSGGTRGLLLIWAGSVYAWNGKIWSGHAALPGLVSLPLHPRYGWTASFDERTGELILYGGRAGAGGPELLGDTVGWSGYAWRTLASAQPTASSVRLGACSPDQSQSGLGGGPVTDPTGIVIEVDFSEPPSGPCHLSVAVTMTVFRGNDMVSMPGNPAIQQLDTDITLGHGAAALFDVHGGCSLDSATVAFQYGDTRLSGFGLVGFQGCGGKGSAPLSITTSVRPLG